MNTDFSNKIKYINSFEKNIESEKLFKKLDLKHEPIQREIIKSPIYTKRFNK